MSIQFKPNALASTGKLTNAATIFLTTNAPTIYLTTYATTV